MQSVPTTYHTHSNMFLQYEVHTNREYVQEDVVDVDLVQVGDECALAVAEAVADVIVPEDEEVLLGGQAGRQLPVPLQVLAVAMAQEQEALEKCKSSSWMTFRL